MFTLPLTLTLTPNPNPKVLDLGWCEIGDASLAALALHCPHMKVLGY